MSAWVLISLWLTGYGYLFPYTLKIVPMPLCIHTHVHLLITSKPDLEIITSTVNMSVMFTKLLYSTRLLNCEIYEFSLRPSFAL